MGHGLHVLRVEFRQQRHVIDDLAQLGRQRIQLVVGQLQPGQQRHFFDVLTRQAHGWSLAGSWGRPKDNLRLRLSVLLGLR
jgi:hypothetical protein